jgi:hypothetical protein
MSTPADSEVIVTSHKQQQKTKPPNRSRKNKNLPFWEGMPHRNKKKRKIPQAMNIKH